METIALFRRLVLTLIMNLSKGKVNLLNALNARKVDFPAKHFKSVTINKANPHLHLSLDKWIYENLNGRYYIITNVCLVDNSITYVIEIGFEI
jgi:hypothetical protein